MPNGKRLPLAWCRFRHEVLRALPLVRSVARGHHRAHFRLASRHSHHAQRVASDDPCPALMGSRPPSHTHCPHTTHPYQTFLCLCLHCLCSAVMRRTRAAPTTSGVTVVISGSVTPPRHLGINLPRRCTSLSPARGIHGRLKSHASAPLCLACAAAASRMASWHVAGTWQARRHSEQHTHLLCDVRRRAAAAMRRSTSRQQRARRGDEAAASAPTASAAACAA